MEKSDQINEISAALSKAQAKIEGAVKDSNNPFFKSKYADLHSVWQACKEHLAANGLAVLQSPEGNDDGKIMVTTMITHSSGQWISGSFTIPVSKNDAQAVGSAITYARRYALAAMVGVCPEDDDGNAATKAPVKPIRKEITPEDAGLWDRAKKAYKRDNNLLAVLKSMDISVENQAQLISECNDVD